MEVFATIFFKLVEALGKVVELIRNLPRVVQIIALVVVVAAASVGVTIYVQGSDDGGGPTAPPKEVVGGVDLVGYCHSFGYDRNSLEHCKSDIDLDAACDWEKREPGHEFILTTPGDLFSGTCINSAGEDVGGIQQMSGYCQHVFPTSPSVEAVADNDEGWVCQIEILMDQVCAAQYPIPDIEARQLESGMWVCEGVTSSA